LSSTIQPNLARANIASRANIRPAAQSAAPAEQPGTQTDSVSLGESGQAAEVAAAPVPEKKEDKGPVKLKPSDLSRPLSHPKASQILKALDPELSLSKLSKTLFENDPAAEHNSSFELRFYEDDDWKSLTLVSTRPLSNGEVASQIHLGAYNSAEEPAKPRFSMEYKPEEIPSGYQLPDLMQKHWGKVFDKSPKEMEASLKEQFGELGKASKIRLYMSDLDQEKPYFSNSWEAQPESGAKTGVRLSQDGSASLTQTVTPEELEKGDSLSPAVREVWKSWGLTPDEMVSDMFSGSLARPASVDVGVTVGGDKKDMVTLGVEMKGRAEDKDKTAGRVVFSLYNKDSEDGKNTRYAYHNLLNFDKEFQGKGLAKSVLRSNFALYDRLKIDKVDLYAAITVGGYAWAKYGWQLKPDSIDKLAEQVRERVDKMKLKPKDKKVVDAILKAKGPKMNWALSDLRQKVEKDGEETTLGKALLLGSRWAGTFDRHDQASMKRLERYLG